MLALQWHMMVRNDRKAWSSLVQVNNRFACLAESNQSNRRSAIPLYFPLQKLVSVLWLVTQKLVSVLWLVTQMANLKFRTFEKKVFHLRIVARRALCLDVLLHH